MRLLLVEDDDLCAAALMSVLHREGCDVERVATGGDALGRFALPNYDAVILDLGLPDLDGGAVLQRARAAGLRAPVLVVSGRRELADRVRSLELGADDHLGKPYADSELFARLRALVRRSTGPRWAPLACGRVVLCHDQPWVLVGGRTVPLSRRER